LFRKRLSEAILLPDGGGAAGFTLIEALVALAVVGVCLSAIGALMGNNIRAVRQINQRLALVSVLRKVETALPDRSKLAAGELSGEMAGHAWSVSASPFPDPSPPPATKSPPPWLPETIVVRVRAPSGSLAEIETLRLVPSAGK
jgi:general secretion pathway protein I